MTEQLKAEAYVRSQQPALVKFIGPRGVPVNHPDAIFDQLPINLQDWLAVLRKTGLQVHISAHQVYCRWEKPCHETVIGKAVIFNLNTGQPNSPEDYKTFNDTVSV